LVHEELQAPTILATTLNLTIAVVIVVVPQWYMVGEGITAINV
jgi:hypothetical protein